ncbi:CPBP family intramembrane glutamic endopeptidase [Xanthomonas arboricola]|uniref:CPBP family intramembrane metalloprotease n=1 Tax=Xanthomonas campestris pv. juglandis TaxID=195709 RepID=A0A8E4ENP9_XANCJ|nr:CPBP family intramembrane glutamic endopeptidase [Xanthomonas arboricola]CAD1788854.1 CPBP family intramembrane metalloprotease [Xanthomonas arboricola pv. juglandis]CAD2255616.1 CPBP family intramembrane metalloprotease [Xanthomonas arboricola]CAD7351402.1 CPBP family intramembrane metalloprotease [Xanthomonas arboricola]
MIAKNLVASQAEGKGNANLLFFLAPLIYLQWAAWDRLSDQYISWLPPYLKEYSWASGYATHMAFITTALATIAVLWRYFPSDFGLTWPAGNSYVIPALVIGGAFGPLMLVVDYYPSLIAHSPPPGPYDTAPSNVAPWLVMQGIFVGISEELVFRSLLLGFALCLYDRQVGLGMYRVSIATVIIAAAFSLAHINSFWETSFIQALGQQFYVLALGIFYGWLFERSGSVLAPAIAHNAGDFIEWAMCFILCSMWQ